MCCLEPIIVTCTLTPGKQIYSFNNIVTYCCLISGVEAIG